MEIAKGVKALTYKKLDLSNYKNSDWAIAIDILDKRLSERYIEPVEILQNTEKEKPAHEKKFGFTILAIDCLLIETLQSFYEGLTDSTGKSKLLFKHFLQQRDNFKQLFMDDLDVNYFYDNFRCGILHQAQTFKNAKIWAVGNLMVKEGDQVIINRDLFHKAVKKEKNIYIKTLSNRTDTILLDNFKKKMDFIAI